MIVKKKLKLKKQFKVVLVLIILFVIAAVVGTNRYEIYKYEQTYEFKFGEIGYSEEEIDILLNTYNESKLEELSSFSMKSHWKFWMMDWTEVQKTAVLPDWAVFSTVEPLFIYCAYMGEFSMFP